MAEQYRVRKRAAAVEASRMIGREEDLLQ